MESKEVVSYLAFESVTARLERTIKRLWITNIILILSILIIVGWIIWDRSQWETVETTTVTQDVEAQADSDSNIRLNTIGGDYYDSESESTSDSDKN